MKRTDFAYELPTELIAQHPPSERSASRLLHVSAATRAWRDRTFAELPELLHAGDLLVFNDTKVIPARIVGAKPSGGRVEILLERILDARHILAHAHASKALRPEVPISLPGGVSACFVRRHEDLYEFELDADPLEYFTTHGAMPLPPYLERTPDTTDSERYQTVYARTPGAVAAPTAGLHFDEPLLTAIAARGVRSAYVTLHVGAGTFQPVRVAEVSEHRMHAERFSVSDATSALINATRAGGGRVVAVGTTVVRTLESAVREGRVEPLSGETRIFITPGTAIRSIDALLTNFHLPESTLLMLVCAFGGYDTMMAAYRHAVAQRYRFFSYGDAVLIEK